MGPDHYRVFMYAPELSVSNQKESPQREPPILGDPLPFRIVQSATAHLKKRIFCGYNATEAASVFQVGWSNCLYFSFFVFFNCSFGFLTIFTYEGTVPYRSSAQMSCREQIGVSFVAIGN
jgi:hypothetical protein